MANCKQPIRTYQRKAIKKPLISVSFAPSVVSTQKHLLQNDSLNNDENRNNSLTHDPFETTFDRIAKGAVVPPLPLDTTQSDSWNSSSDNDINNVTSPVKSAKDISCDPIRNNIFDSTHESVKYTRKYRKPRTYMGVISEPVYKKTASVLKRRDRIQSKTKIQARKVQTNNIQRHKLKKSNRKCNENTHHSDTTNDLKDVKHKDISYNYESSPQRILEINKDTTTISETTSKRANDSVATPRHILNYCQNIKPCCIKLDTDTVQNYISNREKIVRNKQNIKDSYKNILQTSMNAFEPQNMISQSSVTKDSADKVNETNISPLSFRNNLFKTISHCSTSTDSAILDTKTNKEYLIKDSFIKIERLNTEKYAAEKKVSRLNEKVEFVVSSTPVGKQKRSAHLMLLSPIENIRETLNTKYKSSKITKVKENVPINVSAEGKDSVRLLIASKCDEIDIANMQEQRTQVLSPAGNLSVATNPAVEVETVSSSENINPVLTQKYAQSDARTEPHSLNISAGTDRSRSLFGDTIYNCGRSTENITGYNIEKRSVTDASGNKSVKISDTAASLHLSTDANLKQEKGLLIDNAHTDVSSGYVRSPKIRAPIKTEISGDLSEIGRTKQEYESQEKRSREMNSTEIVCKTVKNETVDDSKHRSLSNNRDGLLINAANVHVLLTKLQDSDRITKRMRYSKWHPSVLSISENLLDPNGSKLSNNGTFAINDRSNVPLIENNLKDAINSPIGSPKLLDNVTQQQLGNDTNVQVQRTVFLKPGKFWARSLSILSNVNPRSDLDKLCAGKGKKWRHSVRDILDMQKRGTSWCLEKDQNDTNLLYEGLDTSIITSLNENKKSKITNYGRFSKRISVRVVPDNNANIKCNIKSAQFLEAFGITAKNSPSKLKICEKKLSICSEKCEDEDRVFGSHVATAKDVILQRCSQENYLPFSDCFPDSYLEHCRKIGEGVYGEVFLYEHDNEKSVIKMIPIEGAELVNGESQKKFSEILSEIVIAEELHNLRVHSTCRTDAFVEVRSTKCIIGRYPEKLVKLWNIYDDDKTSDNDCPSMFGEHQLYIALELCHGGEDLEAFVFQTAEEAYALFLQTALALAVAEKAFEFEHRDLHWGNILISRTKEAYVYYILDGKEIKVPSNNVKVSIIDYTLSRMLYQGCCIYNDLALDPALFTAHGEYQFEIYRLMRDKIQNNWQKFEPYTNVLWLHYTLDKMITAVRYKRKNLKMHKQAINKLKELKDTILNYDSAYNFGTDSNGVIQCMST